MTTDGMPSQYLASELISVYIDRAYSFVLTKAHEVLCLGKFADFEERNEFTDLEFSKCSAFNFVQMSSNASVAVFLSEDGILYSYGRDEHG